MRRLAGLVLVLALAGKAGAGELAATAQAAISRYRAEHGLPAVTADPRLMQLATEQARAMARSGVLEHDVDKPFGARMVRYDPDIAVENIAGGTPDFATTLALWKRSPGHDANLRRVGVTRFGIASAPAPQSKYRVFWALIMAGSDGHRGLRQAARPDLMRPGPGQGPVVRVRVERAPAERPHNMSLVSSLKRLLQPLWPGGSAGTR
jgi:hypothetical protein